MNDLKEHTGPLVIAHYERGETVPHYYVMGSNVRMITIDDNAPSDRVYEITNRSHPRILEQLLDGTETIGSLHDGSAAQGRAETIAKAMADDPVPLPVAKKRELPSYLRVIK
jgi:hypothetical protein